MNECLMVNTLKASSSNTGKSEQLPAPECVFWMEIAQSIGNDW